MAGIGKGFTFHGSFQSQLLARRREKEIPGSFIIKRDDRYYVLKPKRNRIKHGFRDPRPTRKNRIKKNPSRGVIIYGRVLKIWAEKTSGPFKGQRFYHTFKRGAIAIGLPDGSIQIKHP